MSGRLYSNSDSSQFAEMQSEARHFGSCSVLATSWTLTCWPVTTWPQPPDSVHHNKTRQPVFTTQTTLWPSSVHVLLSICVSVCVLRDSRWGSCPRSGWSHPGSLPQWAFHHGCRCSMLVWPSSPGGSGVWTRICASFLNSRPMCARCCGQTKNFIDPPPADINQ